MKLEEFIPMFVTIKKDKDCGSYDDFVEVLKLYDLSPFFAGTLNCSSFLFVGFRFTARSRSEMYQASTVPLPSKSKMSKANFTLSLSFALISAMLVASYNH